MSIDAELTEQTRKRYDRMAPIYDGSEAVMERFLYVPWRRLLWSGVEGPDVLEVGVGTGKNMPYYPHGVHVTAIDLSERMLSRARKRATSLGLGVDLRQMDAQALDFPSDRFDAIVASFVFCSVPDPVAGLRELGRVCKPEGEIRLLEHMRARGEVVGRLMDIVNPIAVRIQGANINRRTIDNIESAGLRIERVEDLSVQSIFRLIVARPPLTHNTVSQQAVQELDT
ncbi:MAG TPA: class I SAM-dependent methyltransferase [Anaerolineae bacterium]|nr:class I SAM-dependent methyltransferase [Anaerolineae bacterium]